jgi:inner membrane protein
MDSLTQVALGAAVGIAVTGRHTAVWKAALWGGICGTLPDLDALIDHGDPVRNMTYHRAESHALFYLTLASPLIAWLAARIHREADRLRHWWLAVWLALVTHPLLDLMTVYGTQILRPFTDQPYGVGSIFIIDPLYTLPLLAGVVVACTRGATPAGLRANALGLVLSTAYLGWTVVAQDLVRERAEASLRQQGVVAEQLLVTPTAFNSVLWRVVAMTPDGYLEGFHSLLDDDAPMDFDAYDRGRAAFGQLGDNWSAQRVAWFSRGFFKVDREGDRWTITDLRMGQEPAYVFRFVVAEGVDGAPRPVEPPERIGGRPELGAGLRWLVRRAGGERIPPPR